MSVSHLFQRISKSSYSLTNSCVLPHNPRVLPADRRKRVTLSSNWVSASAHAVTIEWGSNLVVVPRVSSSIHKSAIWIGPPIFIFDFLSHCIDQPATEIDYHRERIGYGSMMLFGNQSIGGISIYDCWSGQLPFLLLVNQAFC